MTASARPTTLRDSVAPGGLPGLVLQRHLQFTHEVEFPA